MLRLYTNINSSENMVQTIYTQPSFINDKKQCNSLARLENPLFPGYTDGGSNTPCIFPHPCAIWVCTVCIEQNPGVTPKATVVPKRDVIAS